MGASAKRLSFLQCFLNPGDGLIIADANGGPHDSSTPRSGTPNCGKVIFINGRVGIARARDEYQESRSKKMGVLRKNRTGTAVLQANATWRGALQNALDLRFGEKVRGEVSCGIGVGKARDCWNGHKGDDFRIVNLVCRRPPCCRLSEGKEPASENCDDDEYGFHARSAVLLTSWTLELRELAVQPVLHRYS